ncbi:kinesin-like protein KIN-12F isoform X2 [Physcomitrium patens]|uniref:Kinesin motor domain-containing protein n=1 Tax=Physcomitrium patens TaxID=3218 RepID=A0A2K1K1M3_PHYPA|nr:kinesin-like protein KIN-12F isoform X2 [Physcomitrium patens]PNR47672.1 hypothetical protein PHYPA_012145 [Physcomitrium patens]|eukprot:XP_024385089.1 kinesin-like protein KIN-12F isoform X2 [Physcomitrella patens]
MNPLRLFSKVVSTSPKKLSFDVSDGAGPAQAYSSPSPPASSPSRPASSPLLRALSPSRPALSPSRSPFVVTTRGDPQPCHPLSPGEFLIPGVESSQEDFAVSSPVIADFELSPPHSDRISKGYRRCEESPASEFGRIDGASLGATATKSSKLPTSCRGKKSTPTQGRGHQPCSSSHGKGNQHRRSLSNIPRLDINAGSTTGDSPLAPPARTLRQSASFSGVSTPRGSRTQTNADSNTFFSGNSGSTPRSAGKPTRYGGVLAGANAAPGTRLPKSLLQHDEEPDRIELEEDPTFWMDHSVQVLIRARPISSAELSQQGVARCVKQENAHTISWLGQPETRFTFDHVAGEFVTQEELFRVAGLPMVDNCMAGYNSCMFAYGQTGSGKTHTMLGDMEHFDQQPNENRGMTPRVFEYLFAKIQKEEESQKHKELKYKCRCSFLEIYNEQISDLLEPASTNLPMREDMNKGVYVEGLLEVEVQNVQDVLHLLLLGATNRKVAATTMNRESSRSHCVFTCIIESQWESDAMINFRFGRLNLVDLAGSERQKATGADGERLREAASINKSLSTLGLVIMVLVDVANGKQRHVPYRDSKLTFLLQDSLGGNSKTTIIANISPSSCASSETLSTLKFAQRAKFIQNNAVINEEATGDVKGLQEQIQQLKDELARVRRQSISRMPSLSPSEDNTPVDASKDFFDPLRSSTEGSFLQFGRAVLGPTALNQKIKGLEGLLAAALRREKFAAKTSTAEIQHLIRLVRQREDEIVFHKSLLQSRELKVRRLEAPSQTSGVEERSVPFQELNLRTEQSIDPDRGGLGVGNHSLQEQLPRSDKHDAFEERATLMQDISDLREKLLEMLDRKAAPGSVVTPQQEALVAELAAERRVAELLRSEVESYQRDLADYHMKLRTSLESNERVASELAASKKELESSQYECRRQKQVIRTLQEKTKEVECLESKQAQHQQFMLELKTQLQKSEEKAEQEASRRSKLELQLQEALQESTNLQTELQWTRDSLEEVEALVATLQKSEPVLEIGDSEASYEAFMIGQLQSEIIEMHKRLEDERKRGRELEKQLSNNPKRESVSEAHHKRNTSTETCNITGKKRVRHHDAIIQLQMELESIDGGSPSRSDPIKGYRWESGTHDEEVEVKHTMTIMQLQLDLETLEGVLAEERQNLAESRAASELLQQKLEEAEAKLEKEPFKVDTQKSSKTVDKIEDQLQQVEKEGGEMAKMQEALSIAREHFNLERQTLVAAAAEVEQRYVSVKKELEATLEHVQSLKERTEDAETRELSLQAEKMKLEEEFKKHVEAARVLTDDLQKQMQMKEEQMVKLKEQMAQKQDWVDKDHTTANLQTKLKSLKNGAFESAQAIGLRCLSRNESMVQLEKKLENMTEAMDQLTEETIQLQREISLLKKDSEGASQLLGQKEEELAVALKKLTNVGDLLEKESNKIQEISVAITEAGRSEESWICARDYLTSKILGLQSCTEHSSGEAELELARTQILLAGSEGKVKILSEMISKMQKALDEPSESEQEMDVVKSSDRPLRRLPENRSRTSLSDGSPNNNKLSEKLRQDVAKVKAENAKLRTKVHEKDNAILSFRMQLSSATTKCKEIEVMATNTEKKLRRQLDSLRENLQTARRDTKKYKDQVQQSEVEMEKLTFLLLQTEERQTKAEQSWMKEKAELQSQKYEAELEAATKKLKLPARFAKIDKWQRQLSEADKLVNMLVKANEKSRQECSQKSVEVEMKDKVILELLDTVAMTKAQLDTTMSHFEKEIRAIVVDMRLLKTDLKRDFKNLRKIQQTSLDEMTMETTLSVKGLGSEGQYKVANVILAENDAIIQNLQAEVAEISKETWNVQTDQQATVKALQKKEETIRNILNEVIHLRQSADRSMSLRQSISDLGGSRTPFKQPADFGHAPLKQDLFQPNVMRDAELGQTPLRRSFSCKLIEEKEMTLSVLKEEQEYLKSMVFSLDTENAELQQQLLDLEAESTALKSTIDNLERELHDTNRGRCEDVAALVEQLRESTLHISELEVQRKELRDEMQRQAVSFAVLYEQLQKQEKFEDGARIAGCKAHEDKDVLQTLEQERAELKSVVEMLNAEMMAQQAESRQMRLQIEAVEADLNMKTNEVVRITKEVEGLKFSAGLAEREAETLRVMVEELESIKAHLEEQLQCSKGATDSKVEELKADRDKLQDDLNLFMDQIEEIQALADERSAASTEARKMAELYRTLADEKEVEVEILGKSVQELENTVSTLESQVGVLKIECERQRLMRQEMESELEGLKNQISIMHAALHEASLRSGDELLETKLRREDAERMLEEREAEMQLLRKKLEKFQMQLEENKPVEHIEPQTPPRILKGQKVQKGSVSPFACMKMNHQIHLELDEERKSYERRIQELEDVLDNHQNEVTVLHEKLADAERMTRDVLRVLRGVKLDMANVATLLDEQHVAEGAKNDNQPLHKDEEIEHILTQLNDFIEERESWLEMISRKQVELNAAQASLENLREREKTLLAENKKLKSDNRNHVKKIGQLEQEIKTLSGQQNLQQRIKHHAKIKEENNSLRIQNNDLNAKLRRAEHLNTRISDELAKYRTSQGKPSTLNIEEEQRLRTVLLETEEQRDKEAQKLSSLCASIVRATGMAGSDADTDPVVALEIVEQMKDRLESTLQEFEDFKIKTRISGERQRLNELRTAHSPMRGMDVQSLTPR